MTESDDPITLGIIALGVGTGLQVAGTIRQGKDIEQIAKARAVADIETAEAVREASVEEARIKSEKRQRMIATQKSIAAAGGIRINVGVPLVIEAETNAEITKDIGFGLQRGRTEADFFRSRAGLEIVGGKVARKQARFTALSEGLLGGASIAFKGADAGLFAKKPIV